MAEELPSPHDSHAEARRHRETAWHRTDSDGRKPHLMVATRFDKLAAEIAAEMRTRAPAQGDAA